MWERWQASGTSMGGQWVWEVDCRGVGTEGGKQTEKAGTGTGTEGQMAAWHVMVHMAGSTWDTGMGGGDKGHGSKRQMPGLSPHIAAFPTTAVGKRNLR